ALLLAILSGGYLASLIGAFKQGWVSASFVGIVVVAALGGAINAPKLRAIRLAIPEGGEKLSTALRNKLLPVSVRLRAFAALSIVFMMAATALRCVHVGFARRSCPRFAPLHSGFCRKVRLSAGPTLLSFLLALSNNRQNRVVGKTQCSVLSLCRALPVLL